VQLPTRPKNTINVAGAPAICTHTPSLAPVLPWFAGRISGWRGSSGSGSYYFAEEDKYYSRDESKNRM
jgi:hypothetical protein